MRENTECLFVRERLFDYANHELAPDDYERVSEHLKACRACRLEAEEIAGIAGALPEAIPVPVKRIRAGVDCMIRADRKKRLLRNIILRFGSMAAAFALVAGMAFWYGRFGLKSQAWWNNANNCNNNYNYSIGKPWDKNHDSAGNKHHDSLGDNRCENNPGEEEIQVTVDRNESMAVTQPEPIPDAQKPQKLFVGSDLDGVMDELGAEALECGSVRYYVLDAGQEERLSECIVRHGKELLYYEVTKNTNLSDNSFIGEAEEKKIRAALDQGMIVVLDISF